MRRRGFTLILALMLLGICGLSLLTVYGSYAALRASGTKLRFGNYNSRGVVSETLRFDRTLPSRLVVDSARGAIRVVGGSSEGIDIEVRKEAWARDEAAAIEAARELELEQIREGDTLILRWRSEETIDLSVNRGGNDRIGLEIQLPKGIELSLTTGDGDIELEGMAAAVVARSDHGNIMVRDIESAVELRARAGTLEAHRIEAGEAAVLLEGSFGKITANQIMAAEIELSSRNGEIDAEDLEAAGQLSLRSDFGSIELRDLRAERLSLSTRNGSIQVEDGQLAGDMEIVNDFGDTRVTGLTATRYAIESQNGAIVLHDARGILEIGSSFGEVEIRAVAPVRLQASSQNGGIDFEGPLDEGASHVVHSDFGGIRLALPEDLGADLSLSTDFGSVVSELPVVVSGHMDERALEGRLNDGGARLEVSTQNGNIRIEALNEGSDGGETEEQPAAEDDEDTRRSTGASEGEELPIPPTPEQP